MARKDEQRYFLNSFSRDLGCVGYRKPHYLRTNFSPCRFVAVSGRVRDPPDPPEPFQGTSRRTGSDRHAHSPSTVLCRSSWDLSPSQLTVVFQRSSCSQHDENILFTGRVHYPRAGSVKYDLFRYHSAISSPEFFHLSHMRLFITPMLGRRRTGCPFLYI